MLKKLLTLTLFGFVASSPAIKSLEGVRIVGGDNIDIKDAPYQASLVLNGRPQCGAAIIAHDIVLTAAHCVAGSLPYGYRIRVGSSSNREGGQLVRVDKLVSHPRFSFTSMDNDVALMWLSTPLVFNENVTAVPLMEQGEEIDGGEMTAVTGWGAMSEGGGTSSTLQQVFVPIVDSKSCGDAYQQYYSITKRMLCAGIPGEGGKDACQGDSGGPLVYNGKLAGVVSWGIGCARPSYPGVYAKVSALRDWIDENIILLRLSSILRLPYPI